MCEHGIERGALQRLADGNMQVENVAFTVDTRGPGEHMTVSACVEYFVDIIVSFSGCPLLKRVQLDSRGMLQPRQKVTAVADACVRLRHRNISVTVDRLEYPQYSGTSAKHVLPLFPQYYHSSLTRH